MPKSEIIFPVKYLIRSVPQPLTAPVPETSPTADPLKYGAHLARVAGCGDCHTPQVQGKEVPGMEFAGGTPFPGPWGNVASANITPDATGIMNYDEAFFLQVIHTGEVNGQKLNSVMPTDLYRNLTDGDLKAIFAYLRSVKPVKHKVDNTLKPTACKLCQQTPWRRRPELGRLPARCILREWVRVGAPRNPWLPLYFLTMCCAPFPFQSPPRSLS